MQVGVVVVAGGLCTPAGAGVASWPVQVGVVGGGLWGVLSSGGRVLEGGGTLGG